MNQFIEQLNRKMATENLNYGEDGIDSVLEMLHFYYTQANPVNSEEIKAGFKAVRSSLEKLSISEIDSLIYTVCDLCLQHEKLAFIEGIKVGFVLNREVKSE